MLTGNMKSYLFRVQLEEEEDGSWSAIVPSLPGCASSGDSIQEAVEYVHDLAEAYVDVLVEDGRAVPIDEIVSGQEGVAIAVNIPARATSAA
jgi:predicted RNase H-like HicB family nuclease